MSEISCGPIFTSSNCKLNKFLATWTKSEIEHILVRTSFSEYKTIMILLSILEEPKITVIIISLLIIIAAVNNI